jgi:two-component system, chemotaxis family, sensor kinase CheA
MVSLDDESAAIDSLNKVIDDLALQIMIKGAKALTPAALELVSLTGISSKRTDVAGEAQRAIKQLSIGPLTDEEAKAIICQMQALIASTLVVPEQIVTAGQVSMSAALDFADDPELLADFVLESQEHLVSIEEKILLLEKDPSLIEEIHAVFRSFHSIKGLAGFLGLTGVQAVAHEVETLLDHARNLRISINSDVVDLVLESSEYLKEEVAIVQAKLSNAPLPGVRDNTALLSRVSAANADVAAGGSLATGISKPAQEPAMDSESAAAPIPVVIPEMSVAPVIEKAPPQTPPPVIPAVVAPFVHPTAIAPAQPTVRPSAPPQLELVQATAPDRPPRVEAASTSIRVETSKLDRLMDMVGEMVIAQSILSNLPRSTSSDEVRLATEMSQLARITSEVQRCAMSMRMMPIGPLFQKNAKMVRDLSRRNGKQVSLQLSGETTELDKTIAEELSDPLLHMIRNALDHGIEPPEERVAAGKSPVASLHIGAEHQAGQIVISISDDGRGLDPQKIRAKALQNGLIEEATQLTDDEIFRLIFAPGFSTAEKITDISGRGVGMDVVRQHVESLRGRIEIKSELGKGTTFLILLPLTLAIIEGLVIVVGKHRYIIPLFSVREMFRPTQDMLFTVQGSEEMILKRGTLLPLIRLHKRFSITPRTEDICEGLLVVCDFAGKLFCLFVDDLLGRQEVVIKSLDEAFKSVDGIVGSAILGDGRIGLILDVAGIFHSPHPSLELLLA